MKASCTCVVSAASHRTIHRSYFDTALTGRIDPAVRYCTNTVQTTVVASADSTVASALSRLKLGSCYRCTAKGPSPGCACGTCMMDETREYSRPSRARPCLLGACGTDAGSHTPHNSLTLTRPRPRGLTHSTFLPDIDTASSASRELQRTSVAAARRPHPHSTSLQSTQAQSSAQLSRALSNNLARSPQSLRTWPAPPLASQTPVPYHVLTLVVVYCAHLCCF